MGLIYAIHQASSLVIVARAYGGLFVINNIIMEMYSLSLYCFLNILLPPAIAYRIARFGIARNSVQLC